MSTDDTEVGVKTFDSFVVPSWSEGNIGAESRWVDGDLAMRDSPELLEYADSRLPIDPVGECSSG